MWIFLAFGSALFAALSSILAKCGIRRTDSDVATVLRTAVVLLFSWIMVFIVGAQAQILSLSAKNVLYLSLSGLATGASWLCYFRALQLGEVNKVVPIDKSSTVLTVLLSILIFSETDRLFVKLAGMLLISAGIFLMTRQKTVEKNNGSKRYIYYAFGSAIFAALTSVLAKFGLEGVNSNLATAYRTAIVLVMAILVATIKGKAHELVHISKNEVGFICLSGIATGASWLCYYGALQDGLVSVVAPIDKLSILFTVAFSYVVFKEKLTRKALVGLALITVGTLIMVIFK